jgi:hypothetical protein
MANCVVRLTKLQGEGDTFLTIGILFSLDKCLLMGDSNSLPQHYFSTISPIDRT